MKILESVLLIILIIIIVSAVIKSHFHLYP